MFDYISLFAWVGLVLVTPLLRTTWWLDVWVLPVWVYASTVILFPIYRSYATIPLQVSTEGEVRLFMVYLIAFILLIRSNLSTEKIRLVLGRLGVLALGLSLVAISINLVEPILEHYGHPFPFPVQFVSGIIPNKSMNCVFVAMLYPFIIYWVSARPRLLVPIFLSLFATAYFSNSSTGILAMFVAMASSVEYRKFPIRGLFGILLFLAIPGMFYLLTNDSVFDGTGRWQMYRMILNNLTPLDYLIGRGPGTFQAWGNFVQYVTQTRIEHGFFLYLHSDPIQYFVEYGLLGVGIILFPLYYFLKHADNLTKPALFAALAGCLFYYPFHFPAHVVLIFLLLKMSYDNSKVNYVDR